MSDYCISYITTPAEVAEQIASTLVKEELAACVNVIDQVVSIYRWEGQVEKSHESLLIVKGTAESTEKMIERIREIHPYEVPEVVTFDITGGNQDYLDWLAGKEIRIDDLEIDDEDIELEEEETAEEEIVEEDKE